MKFNLLAILFIFSLVNCEGQVPRENLPLPSDDIKKKNNIHNSTTAYWDTYMAQYEEGVGTVVLNMDLVKDAPKSTFPFVLITGVRYTNCNPDGFPTEPEFNHLYEISDTISALLSYRVEMIYAGTFTHQCERLDFIYLNDTVGIRNLLNEKYHSRFATYTPYINMKEDKEWKTYLEFLYPTETIQEYMSNEKVVLSLYKEGDNLQTARKVDHWIYFKNENDRNGFIKAIKGMGYKIEEKEMASDSELKYKLHISRTDKIDLNSITEITLALSKIAKENNGNYDGWETEVVK